jgi:hypothetical protein
LSGEEADWRAEAAGVGEAAAGEEAAAAEYAELRVERVEAAPEERKRPGQKRL